MQSDPDFCLKAGTYIRESDGANLVYHNPLTSWNFPHNSLRDYQAGKRYSMGEWRVVNSDEELAQVKEWLCGNLLPGEYFQISAMEIVDGVEILG